MPGAMESPNESEDVSKTFFKLCDGLRLGELVTTEHFRLSDVMSAIELGEPKMDVGVGSKHIKTLKEAISGGLYADDYPFQLAIMDSTLAMVVAWLEGSALGSTVWTNVLLSNVTFVKHPVFHPFASGVNLFIRNAHALINSVGNLEELPEDFNPQMLFSHQRWAPRRVVVQLMREQVTLLGTTGRKWRESAFSKQAYDICCAVASRLEMFIMLLEIIGLLVAPEIEDPNFDHKVHLGDFYVHEKEYEGAEENSDEKSEESTSDPTPSSEAKSETTEKKEQKSNDEATDETDQNDDENVGDDEDEDDMKQFKPNFGFASILAERLCKVTKAYAETVKLGRRAPDNIDGDGDYLWLGAYEPKTCIRMIPACFPRKIKVPSRQEAADWWVKCAERIYHLCIVTPKTSKDLNYLFYFARTFGQNACVFTRSLLQICMFPVDNHLCGDENRSIADAVEYSLSNCFCPQILDRVSPVYKDQTAQSLYVLFLNHMSKLAITVYGSFGCNLSRQRDRLEMAIEDLGQIHSYAGRLEERTDEVLLSGKMVTAKEQNYSYHSVATFVFHNLLAIINHYFELGFRMDLYVPYEFPYIYWFIGSVQAHWMRTTLERSQEIQLNVYQANPLRETKNKKLWEERCKLGEELKRRVAAHQFSVLNQIAISMISDGVVRLTVVLIRKGIIKMPKGGDDAEKLRFERRFEPFDSLGPPVRVDYERFKSDSGIDQMYEDKIETLIDQAQKSFNEAREHLEKIDNSVEQNREMMQLIHVAKSNIIACRVLKLDLTDRNVVWSFSEEIPMFPCLKISKK
ncbi:Protein MAK10 homolog [Caenorhabditis elegans]|uniref:Protein MAK10 homolog n=1 Tax=Caenorhabditis elegans TaxID=6239 RepID=O17003_CAEEL|nr:Protein MAK10 homolog [Caenorhabditis elegans]CCD72916.1 Protein MAK10 homolog [Caenorhabditis elegans]|eukprot:NP_505179.1 N-alpha-AcetylTransferase C complex subunit [Caenorhabditis elegans]